MSVFVDSSAFLALLNSADRHHPAAAAVWEQLLSEAADLRTSSYVVLETAATAQTRFGLESARAFLLDMAPSVLVHWVFEELHDAGVSVLIAAARRGLSLVDCVSFELMRERGIEKAFAFDPHFADQGFECLPDGQGAR
ncbi:MAG: type II toxin-antitoxin system VapC family toxin [Armatimonadota bacterium]